MITFLRTYLKIEKLKAPLFRGSGGRGLQMTGALILYRNVYLLVALASKFQLQQGAGKVWTQIHHNLCM